MDTIEVSNIDPHICEVAILSYLIRKEILANCERNVSHTGWVHAVDPITKSLILLKFKENTSDCSDIIFVPGENVKTIEILSRDTPTYLIQAIDEIFRKEEIEYSAEELIKRREALSSWFTLNRLPHKIDPDLSIQVLEAAKISIPYTIDAIQCSNEIILDKIIKLIKSAPGFE